MELDAYGNFCAEITMNPQKLERYEAARSVSLPTVLLSLVVVLSPLAEHSQ
jgi:hypothetical protein